jgi:SAM-dependent methyltransferase
MKNVRRLLKDRCPWILPARDKLTRMRAFVRYYALIVAYRVRHPQDSVFETIYRKHTWGRESRSGSGSEAEQTAAIKQAIPSLVAELNVRSILDAACGDYGWMSEIRLAIDSYVGLDIVPEMVAENQKKYGSESVRFLHLDITKDDLPRADLILCRDCLVHMSFNDIFRSLRAFKASGSTYLLTTTYPGALRRHWNIVTGMWRPLDLELPPFNLPKPIKLINESTTEVTDYRQKSLGLWALMDLPV